MAAGNGARQALSPGTHRVYFALWPDEDVRAELARTAQVMHRVMHGRLARSVSLHLTLAFIGRTDAENLQRLLSPPADVFTPAFLLALDDWGCWPRNSIGWTAPTRIPGPLRDLAANLEGWLRSAGFELEHRTFAPHVTLIRSAQCVPMPGAMAPIEWQVNEIALIRSQPVQGGHRYSVLRTWPLE